MKVIKNEQEMMREAAKLKVGQFILVDPELPVGLRIAELEGEFTFCTGSDGSMRVTRIK